MRTSSTQFLRVLKVNRYVLERLTQALSRVGGIFVSALFRIIQQINDRIIHTQLFCIHCINSLIHHVLAYHLYKKVGIYSSMAPFISDHIMLINMMWQMINDDPKVCHMLHFW